MVDAFDDLYQIIVGVDAAGSDAPGFVLVAVVVVALAAVAVALDDLGRAVSLGGQAALGPARSRNRRGAWCRRSCACPSGLPWW